jgi:hypothetical protein
MDDERPAEPVVERVARPDGRYLLYFSWPDEPPLSTPSPRQPAEGQADGTDE